MSRDPYYPPPPAQDYRSDYPPDPAYASRALTTTHRPASGAYLPPNDYGDSRQERRSKHRDNSYYPDDERDTRRSSRARIRSHSRHRSKSRTKEYGATAAGGAAGAWLGHELGGQNVLGTVGGLVAGAWGAREAEKQFEKRREKKRFEEEGYSYGGGGDRGDRPRHHRRKSSGNLIDGIKTKVQGFIEELDGKGGREKERERDRRDKRRSRSHVPRSKYDDSSDGSYEYERVERRRPRRDDHY